MLGGAGKFLTGEHQRVKNELTIDVERQYIDRECRKAREAKEKEHENLKKIREAWNGVGVAACFKACVAFFVPTQRLAQLSDPSYSLV